MERFFPNFPRAPLCCSGAVAPAGIRDRSHAGNALASDFEFAKPQHRCGRCKTPAAQRGD
ncbi:hypothetical protein GLA29479_1948 [Lysobacter antibioticus]|nr:hypothetical protein GLA29479_1948 [Lysobacter antibioticus]